MDYFNKLQVKTCKYTEKYKEYPVYAACKMILFNFAAIFKLLIGLGKTKAVNSLSKHSNFRIAFRMAGGIGDILINARWVEVFCSLLKQTYYLDLYIYHVPLDVAKGIFWGKKYINQIIHKEYCNCDDYDMVIRLTRFPVIEYISSLVNISDFSSELSDYVKLLQDFENQHKIFYQEGTESDRLGMQYAMLTGHTRATQADINDVLHIADYPFVLERDITVGVSKLVGNKPFITIQRGAKFQAEATKVWPLDKYNDLVKLLKKTYPQYQIVQLGMAEVPLIDGIDIDLRGKTNFEELKAILVQSVLHIDCEGGLVHMRHFLCRKPSVVLFGPTSKEFYGYDENINIISNGSCHDCEWIHREWNEKCLFKEYMACMNTITPQMVIDKIVCFLN